MSVCPQHQQYGECKVFDEDHRQMYAHPINRVEKRRCRHGKKCAGYNRYNDGKPARSKEEDDQIKRDIDHCGKFYHM